MTENKTEMTLQEMKSFIQDVISKLDSSQKTISQKINLYDELFLVAIEMYRKHRNKTGFLNIFFRYNKDLQAWQEKKNLLMKKELLAYAEKIKIDLHYSIVRHQLDVSLENMTEKTISFSDFIKEIREEEKEKRLEEKEKLKKIKTIDISKIKNLDEVKSLLLRLQEKKKDLMKNQD